MHTDCRISIGIAEPGHMAVKPLCCPAARSFTSLLTSHFKSRQDRGKKKGSTPWSTRFHLHPQWNTTRVVCCKHVKLKACFGLGSAEERGNAFIYTQQGWLDKDITSLHQEEKENKNKTKHPCWQTTPSWTNKPHGWVNLSRSTGLKNFTWKSFLKNQR